LHYAFKCTLSDHLLISQLFSSQSFTHHPAINRKWSEIVPWIWSFPKQFTD
jgi:hypothetical protein